MTAVKIACTWATAVICIDWHVKDGEASALPIYSRSTSQCVDHGCGPFSTFSAITASLPNNSVFTCRKFGSCVTLN